MFDEIQTSSRALTSLKYSQEQAGELHVAAAGSLLGVHMARPGSFPVGKVNFLDLAPMDFVEFLEVKAGLGRRSKSLRSYDGPFAPDLLVRTTRRNLRLDGRICNIPLYAISALPRMVRGGMAEEPGS